MKRKSRNTLCSDTKAGIVTRRWAFNMSGMILELSSWLNILALLEVLALLVLLS